MLENLARQFERQGAVVEVGAGSVLYQQGQRALGAYFLCEGAVAVSLHGVDGSSLWSRTLRPGSVMGIPATLMQEEHELTALALQRSVTWYLDQSTLAAAMQKDPAVAGEVLSILSYEVAELRRKIAMLRSGSESGTAAALNDRLIQASILARRAYR